MGCLPVHKIGFGAMFNWSDMRFFLELARLRHLSATATRMRVDTSTVSRRIAELERSLNAKLFERAAEGFFLTEDGQKVFAYAEKMETTAADISFALTGGATDNSGIVRVATMEGFATLVIASEWGLLRKSHPQIALELLVVSQPTNLGRREADISFTMMELKAPRLISHKIGRFAVNLYASPEYLQRGAPENKSDLKDHSFIDYLDAFVAVSEVKWLTELAPDAKIVLQSTSLIAQQQAAIAGVGIAALPDYAAIPKDALVKILPNHTIWRDLWMTVHEDNQYLPHIKVATQFFRKQLPLSLTNVDSTTPQRAPPGDNKDR